MNRYLILLWSHIIALLLPAPVLNIQLNILEIGLWEQLKEKEKFNLSNILKQYQTIE